MLLSPSLDILFSLYAVLSVRIENIKQPYVMLSTMD